MNYEYGIEYPCNGVKPDLPDDVLVEWYGDGDWYAKDGGVQVRELGWNKGYGFIGIDKFRIVDKRYKPKSDWFEAGELPPVGEVVLGYVQDSSRTWRWLEVEVLKHNSRADNECAVHVLKHAILRWCDNFKPLKNERDELVEKAEKVINNQAWASKDLAIALIDAGWRPQEGK